MAEGIGADYFGAFDAKVTAGRFFTDADYVGVPTIVIADRFRRRVFGDSAGVIGETVTLDGKPAIIIGVAAAGFDGLQFDGGADIFMPLQAMQAIAGGTRTLRARSVVAQLAPGLSIAKARAELVASWPRIQEATVPSTLSASEQAALRALRIELEPARSGVSTLRDRYGESIVTLVGLCGLLMTIAGVNLAGLFLARALARRNQAAVRLAVGATRLRAVFPLLLEGALLSLGGYLLSVPIAVWTTRQLTPVFSFGRTTPLIQNLSPDPTLLAASAILAAAVGVAISGVPAWYVTARASALQPQRSAVALSRAGQLLIVVQVALSMMLMVGAGLFASSLAELRTNYDSIRARNVIFTRLARVHGDTKPIDANYWRALMAQLQTLPGAQSVSLATTFPTYFQFAGTLPTDSYSTTADSLAQVSALTEFVSPEFFSTVGIARLQGRDFSWTDTERTTPVVILTQSVAAELFSGIDPVGRRVRTVVGNTTKEYEVIGIVDDGPFGSVRTPRQDTVFRPIFQEPSKAGTPILHLRHGGDLGAMRNGYASAVTAFGRHFTRTLFTLDEFADAALLKERMTAWLSTLFGALVMVLACIGVFSMLAYAVVARTREIGIRSAIGATRARIARMVVREGLLVGVPGILLGVWGSLAMVGIVESQLYGVEPRDPAIIVWASIALGVAVVLASLAPALWASKVVPSVALRQP